MNLCGAFEMAVPPTEDGFVGPSCRRLIQYAQNVYQCYADAPVRAFTIGMGLEALADAQPLNQMLDALQDAVAACLAGNGVA